MSEKTVNLLPFSRKHAIGQGSALYRITHDARARAFLELEGRHETLERYRDRFHAIYNVARIATSHEVKAFVVCHHDIARGVGTLIFDQTIAHPDGPEVTGTNVDYWIIPGLNHSIHDAIAEELVSTATAQGGGPAFAVVTHRNGQINGFRNTMRMAAPPDVLTTSMETDTYGITNGGKVSELYVKY